MSRRIRIAVLGAGSWGTTVASLASRNTQTTLWARDPATADEINREHRNTRYLKDLPLCSRLLATASMAEAVRDCDVLVVGVPSHSFRDTLRAVSPLLRPWVPVISLAKGLEQG
ncbi:MAG: 2-dehydropantoate 2-reductase N-terminal domain-containing protein, partial [Nevskia sp.]